MAYTSFNLGEGAFVLGKFSVAGDPFNYKIGLKKVVGEN